VGDDATGSVNVQRLRGAVVVLVLAIATSGSTAISHAASGLPSGLPPAGGPPGFVFVSGLDHGPVGAASPGMHQSDGPGTVLEWQDEIHRTGTGAYHAVGGDLQGDETIGNQASAMPFGGLEVWVGGAFRFASFPDEDEDVWLIATVPSDGVLGADDKPVVSIDSAGRLRLSGSNSRLSVRARRPLSEDRWYSLVLHGLNGVSRTQQLFVYNGRTDALIERLDLEIDVTGSFVNQLTKWGFGTSQDSSGLEYYLDDVYHARGGGNPGPVRVFPRAATGSQGNGFVAVGAPSPDEAVDDEAPDADATYVAGRGFGTTVFPLAALPRRRGERVRLVQVTAIGRSASSSELSALVGIRVDDGTFSDPVTLGPEYRPAVAMWAANPSSGGRWRVRDRISGIVEDPDPNADEMRFTAIWWDVVYAPART
jgi:hypothetical protein